MTHPRIASILLVALLAGACTSADTPSSSTAPTAAPATSTPPSTVTTLAPYAAPPFVSAFDAVDLDWTHLDDSDGPLDHPTLQELAERTMPDIVPLVVFRESYSFSPSNMDLELAGPVEFTNESDRDIVIEFDGLADPVEVASGATRVVDLSGVEPGLIRYGTVVGLQRPAGVIDLRGSVASGSGSATDWTAALQLELPANRRWRVASGHRSLTIVPDSTLVPQGAVAAALLFDVELFDAALRIDASSDDDAATAARRLESTVVPAGCAEPIGIDPSHPGFDGAALQFECGLWSLEIGYLASDEAIIYYSFADIDDEFELADALGSLQVGEPGAFAVEDDEFRFSELTIDPNWVGIDDLVLDIVNGALGPPFTERKFHIVSTDRVRLRNFDSQPWQVFANGDPFLEVAPREEVAFSIDDFDVSHVVLSIGEYPWARLDLTLNRKLREPLEPVTVQAYPGPVTTERRKSRFLSLLASGDIDELVPQGWEAVLEFDDFVQFERRAGPDDGAQYTRSFAGSIDSHLLRNVIELRMRPTEVLQLDEGILVRFEVPDRPWVSILFTSLIEGAAGQAGWALELVSAPEEHDRLVQELLLPAGAGFAAEVDLR